MFLQAAPLFTAEMVTKRLSDFYVMDPTFVSFVAQIAESVLPQDQDLEAWKVFAAQVEQNVAAGKRLTDQDYKTLTVIPVSSNGGTRKLSGRTPEVIFGHVKFQESYFQHHPKASFETMFKNEMENQWNLPFGQLGGTDAQRLSLINFVSRGDLAKIQSKDKFRWANLKKEMNTNNPKPPKTKGASTTSSSEGCSGSGPSQNTRSRQRQRINTRQMSKVIALSQAGLKLP